MFLAMFLENICPMQQCNKQKPHRMLLGENAGAKPFRNSRHHSSVMPLTRSGCPELDIIYIAANHAESTFPKMHCG